MDNEMRITDPLSWAQYIDYVRQTFADLGEARKEADPISYYSDILFRGQADESWELETSLERYLKNEQFEFDGKIEARRFYRIIDSIIPALNSLASKKFSRIDTSSLDLSNKYSALPHSELLSYARHHGFPSPLLDWSRSFYVAAFFAYSHAVPETNSAVYMFQEWTGDARGGWVGTPMITAIGHYINTDQRHFRQQSEYTFCSAILEDKMFLCRHEQAVREAPSEHKITKIVLDHRCRKEALIDLSIMNVNDYTLYGDEDALMRNLAFEKFVRSDLWKGG